MQNPITQCHKCKKIKKITTIILDKDATYYLCETCSLGIDEELNHKETMQRLEN